MRRSIPLSLAAAATTIAAAVASLAPAHAITYGEADEGRHPMVGLMSAQSDGSALWRCSGTLVSPTLFVTAGHCTSDDNGGSVDNVELWFAEGPIDTNGAFLADAAVGEDANCINDETGATHPGYPCTGEVSGTPYTHPEYDPAQFWMWDLGVVVLDEPVVLDEYGTLPEAGAYDGWKSSRKQRFTSVGYGLQEDYPDAAAKDVAVKRRMVSHPRLISVNSPYVGDYNMKLSNNANTGGTCGGDSGGPNFLGLNSAAQDYEIVGVTSYGMNAQTCGGIGGIYRLDRDWDAVWLRCFRDGLAAPDACDDYATAQTAAQKAAAKSNAKKGKKR